LDLRLAEQKRRARPINLVKPLLQKAGPIVFPADDRRLPAEIAVFLLLYLDFLLQLVPGLLDELQRVVADVVVFLGQEILVALYDGIQDFWAFGRLGPSVGKVEDCAGAGPGAAVAADRQGVV